MKPLLLLILILTSYLNPNNYRRKLRKQVIKKKKKCCWIMASNQLTIKPFEHYNWLQKTQSKARTLPFSSFKALYWLKHYWSVIQIIPCKWKIKPPQITHRHKAESSPLIFLESLIHYRRHFMNKNCSLVIGHCPYSISYHPSDMTDNFRSGSTFFSSELKYFMSKSKTLDYICDQMERLTEQNPENKWNFKIQWEISIKFKYEPLPNLIY